MRIELSKVPLGTVHFPETTCLEPKGTYLLKMTFQSETKMTIEIREFKPGVPSWDECIPIDETVELGNETA